MHTHAGRLTVWYCAWQGVPACANSEIMTHKMRGTWNFTGSIVSDDGAIKQLTNCTKNHTARCPDGSMTGGHNFAISLPEAAALALKAGCDVDYGGTFASPTWGVPAAMQQGLVAEQDLRAAVRHSLTTRFITGEYDDDAQHKPEINPWNALDANKTVNWGTPSFGAQSGGTVDGSCQTTKLAVSCRCHRRCDP